MEEIEEVFDFMSTDYPFDGEVACFNLGAISATRYDVCIRMQSLDHYEVGCSHVDPICKGAHSVLSIEISVLHSAQHKGLLADTQLQTLKTALLLFMQISYCCDFVNVFR